MREHDELQDSDAIAKQPRAENCAAEVGGIAVDQLRSFIEWVERLQEDRRTFNQKIKNVFSDATSAGFNAEVIRTIILLRKKKPADAEGMVSLLALYHRVLDTRKL